MKEKLTKGEPFFYYFSIVLLFTVVFAFGANILLKKYNISSPTPVIVAHGMAMLLWYSLLVWQTKLIRIRNIHIHKLFGMGSIALAIVIVVSGLMVAVYAYKAGGKALNILAEFINIFNFLILFTAAFLMRRHLGSHKRLMILASLAILVPALGRIVRIIGVNEFIAAPFWLLFLLVLPVYDMRKSRHIYPATYLGTGLIIIGFVCMIVIGTSDNWANIVKSFFEE